LLLRLEQFDHAFDSNSGGILGLCSDATAGVFYVYDENSIFEISIYVVAKSGCSKESLPFLKKELVCIINNKRIHREQLWRKGVVRGSRMTSLKNIEFVGGTEKDPECIICQYFLHLSVVVCNCRPDTFVCLQHVE
jgi:histone demethylase JARID1